MSWHNKVVWCEGLFLRPQLFQQQERYLEMHAHRRAAPLSPFYWGFSRYQLDIESLALGKLVLAHASGVFFDGTPFDTPSQTPPPPPLTILPEHLGQLIYLALPIRSPNAEETSFDDAASSLARYAVSEVELRDGNAINQGPQLVQLAQLRLRLLPQKELSSAWIGLPIARVSSLHTDGSVILDGEHIPPLTSCTANDLLKSWLVNVHGLAHLRAAALSARLNGAEGRSSDTAEVSDYLLLQMINRYEPHLSHLLAVGQHSPETFYLLLASFAGELATYIRTDTRRPLPLQAYRHLDPHLTFQTLVGEVQSMLNEVLVRSAQRVALDVRPHGMHLATADPALLREFASIVLAVAAHMPPDELMQQFAAQSKIGPSQRLPELIRSHLPGISLSALPVPPRQIPFNAGYIYYELAARGPLWEDILAHGGLALHVAGTFPGLKIELWGVRNR